MPITGELVDPGNPQDREGEGEDELPRVVTRRAPLGRGVPRRFGRKQLRVVIFQSKMGFQQSN